MSDHSDERERGGERQRETEEKGFTQSLLSSISGLGSTRGRFDWPLRAWFNFNRSSGRSYPPPASLRYERANLPASVITRFESFDANRWNRGLEMKKGSAMELPEHQAPSPKDSPRNPVAELFNFPVGKPVWRQPVEDSVVIPVAHPVAHPVSHPVAQPVAHPVPVPVAIPVAVPVVQAQAAQCHASVPEAGMQHAPARSHYVDVQVLQKEQVVVVPPQKQADIPISKDPQVQSGEEDHEAQSWPEPQKLHIQRENSAVAKQLMRQWNQQQQQHNAEQTPMWELLVSLICSILVIIFSIIITGLVSSAKHTSITGDTSGIEHIPSAQFMLTITVICLVFALALVVLESLTLGLNLDYRRSCIVVCVLSVLYAALSFLLFGSACSVIAVRHELMKLNELGWTKFDMNLSIQQQILGGAICALIEWLCFVPPLILLLTRSPRKRVMSFSRSLSSSSATVSLSRGSDSERFDGTPRKHCAQSGDGERCGGTPRKHSAQLVAQLSGGSDRFGGTHRKHSAQSADGDLFGGTRRKPSAQSGPHSNH